MSRIENIVVKKCKAIFESKKPMISETAIQTELRIFQSKILNIQNDIKALNNKSDSLTIGSLTYMANEYDDFSVKMTNFASAKQSLRNDISHLTKKMFKKKQIKTERDLKRLEQYGRRENLEIHGIPFTQKWKDQRNC